MILKSLDKNLKNKIIFYQNLIVFNWDSASFKKRRKILWNHHWFLFFITMAHTTQNSSKKHFINNQLEFFFFFSFKTKYIYDFLKPKSQTSKDSKRIITYTKSIMFDYNIKIGSYCHSIKTQAHFLCQSLIIHVRIK